MRVFFITLFSVILFSCTSSSQLKYQSGIDTCFNQMTERDDGLFFLPSPECLVGYGLPTFELETREGKLINNKSIEGKLTLINFWFIGCPPCEAEIPGLDELAKKYHSKGVNFIAIGRNDDKKLRTFLETHPWKAQHVNDPDSKIMNDIFQMGWGFPTTFIIDKEGIIQKAFTGGPSDASAPALLTKTLIPILDALLN